MIIVDKGDIVVFMSGKMTHVGLVLGRRSLVWSDWWIILNDDGKRIAICEGDFIDVIKYSKILSENLK